MTKDEKLLARLTQLARISTITHVDGRAVPASRVLVWLESSLVRLGADPVTATDGRVTSAEFTALDPHDLARFSEPAYAKFGPGSGPPLPNPTRPETRRM